MIYSDTLSSTQSTWFRFNQSPKFWLFFDGILLVCGIYHALNGVNNVIADYNPSQRMKKLVLCCLWVVGVVAFILGFILLGRFLGFGQGEFADTVANAAGSR